MIWPEIAGCNIYWLVNLDEICKSYHHFLWLFRFRDGVKKNYGTNTANGTSSSDAAIAFRSGRAKSLQIYCVHGNENGKCCQLEATVKNIARKAAHFSHFL